MKYYLIAGEASGDMHGANLMQAIQAKDPQAEFRFWGGDKMAKITPSTQVEHYKNTAFMGFWEVVKNLRTILSFIKKCKEDIAQWQPDTLILIDYPGFNMRIAKFAKTAGFRVVYYISPQVWAWKENRVKKIKTYVDEMLVILPFEKDFYEKKWQYPVHFVGHPLLDEIAQHQIQALALKAKDKPIIAMLPGSRVQEIQKILPVFLQMVSKFPDYQFVLAGLGHLGKRFYEEHTKGYAVDIVIDQTYPLLHESYAALVASGTATLEAALFETPMVVGYKGSWLSYQIGKRLVDIKYISLVNLIMDKEIVKELIQNDLNEQTLQSELAKTLNMSTQYLMREDFKVLKKILGNQGASAKAAQIICTV